MAYEPTVWKTGDVVTSEKLNKLEKGVEDAGPLIVHDEDGVLDKTWQEIYDAGLAIIFGEGFKQLVDAIYENDNDTPVSYNLETCATSYITNAADGYPHTRN